ncbi:hypothetical protein AQUSIP_20560 [Aquicella siphonis]|uniref:Zinc transporter ZupT n=1 Tax=Aquicella siphonis TaxID=254247 RepID=A0A5E4PK18_9COXI|nr:ZIP family metal transporter [Aquicella siphonis]VVC76731.1 hypothetical protein AQUSIP_20560 [Aquicella siphonis]
MTLFDYKIIAALIIFLLSAAFALYPLKKKRAPRHTESVELGEALASGIFLGAALFHMLPDAIELFGRLYDNLTYPLPEAIAVLGYLLMLLLERFSSGSMITSSRNAVPYVLAIVLIIHALTEGAALGIGSTLPETLMLFIAIIAHKGSESFALCVTLLRHQLPYRRIFLVVIFFSLMTPVGISLGAAIHQFTFSRSGEWAAAVFNAFAAGTFLYISTLHHIHFHQHSRDTQGLLEYLSLAAGVAAMGLIALWT